MERQEKDVFLGLFYDHYIGHLLEGFPIDPVAASTEDLPTETSPQVRWPRAC